MAKKTLQIEEEAKKAISLDPKNRKCGGYALKHKCNCYGLTFKYIFHIKNLTFVDVGNLIGLTPQAINHIVNRMPKKSFMDEDFVERICKKLRIDTEYFYELSEKVNEIMER